MATAIALPVFASDFHPIADASQETASSTAIERANALLTENRPADALRLFKQALAGKSGNCPECLWGMAQAYNLLGAGRDAIETCDRFLQQIGDDKQMQAAALNLRGMAAWSMGRSDRDAKMYRDAEDSFRRAIPVAPDMAVLWYNLGMVLLATGRDDAGIEQLRTYLQKEPQGRYAPTARSMIENPLRGRDAHAPEFSGTTADGRFIDLQDLRGKVVVLDFWATWCGPCKKALPHLRDLVKRYSTRPFVLISISSDTDEQAWRRFIADNKMSWPQLLDTGTVSVSYGVAAIPAYVVIDQTGVRKRTTSDWMEARAEVDRCFKTPK